MTRNEHLLTILAEECAEVAQRVSKALRFGINDVQAGQELPNRERLRAEFADLLGAAGMLNEAGLLPWPESHDVIAKKQRIAVYLEYSKTQGTFTEVPE